MKKYMKKQSGYNNSGDYNLIKIFIISFCVMLLVFTVLIKSFSPSVDVSIGDYKQDETEETADKNVDGRLAMLQDEDRSKSFTELMKNSDENQKKEPDIEKQEKITITKNEPLPEKKEEIIQKVQPQDVYYKVYIGSYTSSEQAKVAKDIIIESGNGLNPIVKCIGSNNYTLQVGIFKNRTSAESLLYTVQQNHLPGRIVQEY